MMFGLLNRVFNHKRTWGLAVLTAALSVTVPIQTVFAKPRPMPVVQNSPNPVSFANFRVVGVDAQSADIQSIVAIVDDLLGASNSKNLAGILNHYSPSFVSGDNLTLDQVRKLIEETWQVYPNIRYQSNILEIRVNGDWATVETLDEATATVKDEHGVINTPGELKSQSRGMIYLRRIGNTWEITSDSTLYENSTIVYGNAKGTPFSLSAPDHVFAGEPYSAKVNVDLPPGTVAIASITKDPLVYPQLKPVDKFRSITRQAGQLERVFDANEGNNNEMVTATIGLTQIGQDSEERPTVQFNGIATVIKRVNVVPKTNREEHPGHFQMVKTSADGKVDLSNAKDAAGDEEMPDTEPAGTPVE